MTVVAASGVPVGGVEFMVLGAVVSGVFFAIVALLLHRWLGWVTGWALPGLLWSLVVIALVTLVPAEAATDVVSADGRLPGCSWDIGGPAPEGFWIFDGAQRTLNTALFIPSGALLVLTAARWRAGWVLIPLGLALLAGFSAGIEYTQLELARIDRACDVTDVVDNVTGALVGVGVGLVLALVLRPWEFRRTWRPRR